MAAVTKPQILKSVLNGAKQFSTSSRVILISITKIMFGRSGNREFKYSFDLVYRTTLIISWLEQLFVKIPVSSSSPFKIFSVSLF